MANYTGFNGVPMARIIADGQRNLYYSGVGNNPYLNLQGLLNPNSYSYSAGPFVDNANYNSNVTNFLNTGAGLATLINPALGATIGGISALYNAYKSNQQKKEIQRQIESERQRRAAYENLYLTNLERDLALRNLLQRGQGAYSPFYRNALSTIAKNQNINRQITDSALKRSGVNAPALREYLNTQAYNNQINNLNNSLVQLLANTTRMYNEVSPYVLHYEPEKLGADVHSGYYGNYQLGNLLGQRALFGNVGRLANILASRRLYSNTMQNLNRIQ